MPERAYKPDPTLLFTIQMLKSQARQISDLCGEIAALHETVKGLDPTFGDVWKQKTAEVEEAITPSRKQLLDRYDELLEAVKTGDTSRL